MRGIGIIGLHESIRTRVTLFSFSIYFILVSKILSSISNFANPFIVYIHPLYQLPGLGPTCHTFNFFHPSSHPLPFLVLPHRMPPPSPLRRPAGQVDARLPCAATAGRARLAPARAAALPPPPRCRRRAHRRASPAPSPPGSPPTCARHRRLAARVRIRPPAAPVVGPGSSLHHVGGCRAHLPRAIAATSCCEGRCHGTAARSGTRCGAASSRPSSLRGKEPLSLSSSTGGRRAGARAPCHVNVCRPGPWHWLSSTPVQRPICHISTAGWFKVSQCG